MVAHLNFMFCMLILTAYSWVTIFWVILTGMGSQISSQ